MRVSNRSLNERLLMHIQTASTRLNETQERVASGKRVQRSSDDPFAANRSIQARSDRNVIEQRVRTINLAQSELAVTESAVVSLSNVLTRAQALSVQADSAGLDASARNQIAAEVDELINEALQVANSSHGGRRIFGGHQAGTPPFVPDVPGLPTTVTYQGDAGLVLREIGDGEQIAVNLDGNALFDGAFTSLIAFRDGLRANDRTAINAAATAIGAEIEVALQARGDIGARVRRLDIVSERLQGDDERLRGLVAELEEVDLTSEVVELQMRDMAFQAALSATGRSLNMSLLDYLR
jgi:flagellar hook-associated protein 3 FlgL